jgi:hypothetical protein
MIDNLCHHSYPNHSQWTWWCRLPSVLKWRRKSSAEAIILEVQPEDEFGSPTNKQSVTHSSQHNRTREIYDRAGPFVRSFAFTQKWPSGRTSGPHKETKAGRMCNPTSESVPLLLVDDDEDRLSVGPINGGHHSLFVRRGIRRTALLWPLYGRIGRESSVQQRHCTRATTAAPTTMPAPIYNHVDPFHGKNNVTFILGYGMDPHDETRTAIWKEENWNEHALAQKTTLS